VQVGVRMAEAICKRLRFSNEDTEQILALVDNHMKFGAVEEMRASTLKKFVRLPRFEEHLALHRLDCLSSHRHLESYDFVRRFLEVTPPEQVQPERLLTGDDLQEMGFRPSPLFSQILQALEDAQLEEQIRTREEAKEYVLSRYGSKKQKASSS
jgi:poly(A) polymerase